MKSLPELAICVVTYGRTDLVLQTIKSTSANLNYPKEKVGWYIADDGTPQKEHIQMILYTLEDLGERVIGHHSERMRNKGEQATHNAGLGWNKGLGLCHQFSDYVLWLEDDWNLDEPLDLRPHVKILSEREDVGAFTYRILSAGADVHTIGCDGEMYLQYLRTTQYAYSGNPHLRHARFTRSYGWFAEDRNPGNMELHMDDQYRLGDGPAIWRPTNISNWGAWKHIGTEKSWK